jgi:hypothetical protein
MGGVFRARDHKLDRDVVLKMLPAALADDRRSLERIEREAKATGSRRPLLSFVIPSNPASAQACATQMTEELCRFQRKSENGVMVIPGIDGRSWRR